MSNLEQALMKAFYATIAEVGFAAFRATSLFPSNEKKNAP